MNHRARSTRKWVLALGLGALLAALSATAAAATAPKVQRQGTLYSMTCGPSIYRFDAAWRVETIWSRDGEGSWTRVALPEPAEMDRLRRLFLIKVGRPSLQDVPAEGQEELARLRSLGYI
jgi:hypothetical protein